MSKFSTALGASGLIIIFAATIGTMIMINYKFISKLKIQYAWWEHTSIYHVYLPSFFDTNSDGIGDIKGLQAKLNYLQDLGMDSIWISSFYLFGGKDMGFDVVNHTEVDPLFGTMEEMDELLYAMKKRGFKVILDLIPSHTSNQNKWFLESSAGNKSKYSDYYVWKNPQYNSSDKNHNKKLPPNEWTCNTGESAWTYVEARNQYYLHYHLPEMPDLNLRNLDVQNEIISIMRFWLNKPSIYGFHIQSFDHLIKDFTNSNYITSHVTDSKILLDKWSDVIEEYEIKDNNKRLLLLEMTSERLPINWLETIEDLYSKRGTIPFSFTHLLRTQDGNLIMHILHKYVNLVHSHQHKPTWEIDDMTKINSINNNVGRLPRELMGLVLILTLFLPGGNIIYYGDEIGMINNNNISFANTKDPYVLSPYKNEKNYMNFSRDPSRSPMQWSSSLHSGFTNGTPWLPIHSEYPYYNTETCKNTSLSLFKRLMKLRSQKDVCYGDLYFPYNDHSIVTFIRKWKDFHYGYLICVNIGSESHRSVIDFANVVPYFPKDGIIQIVYDFDKSNKYYSIGDSIDLSNVILDPYDALIIKVNFKDYNVKG